VHADLLTSHHRKVALAHIAGMMAPTTFTLFGRLPSELREKIWRDTIEPRVVRVEHHNPRGFHSSKPLPAPLHGCQESRRIYLRIYRVSFSSIWHPIPKIYFNFDIDTLHLSYDIQDAIPLFFAGLKQHEITSIKYLALDDRMGDPDSATKDLPHDAVKRLSDLKILYEAVEIADYIEAWNIELKAAYRWEYDGTDPAHHYINHLSPDVLHSTLGVPVELCVEKQAVFSRYFRDWDVS
jgi:hypothetical protein